MHVIKIGNLYVAADGTLTARQTEALRVEDVRSDQSDAKPRLVKIVPRRDQQETETEQPTT